MSMKLRIFTFIFQRNNGETETKIFLLAYRQGLNKSVACLWDGRHYDFHESNLGLRFI